MTSRWPSLVVIFIPALSLLAATAAHAAPHTLFRFPLVDPTGELLMQVPIIHVDHDPKTSATRTECLTFDGRGFPFCYDGHDGTDYLLIFGFATMDRFDVKVVAAADGEVVFTRDGNYDRCHETKGFVVTCDGNPMVANAVKIRHADGVQSWYWHLKKGSVKVKVGQKVRCGDLLAYVGSSGMSATPHLHFEVRDNGGKLIDPYAGKNSQPESYWTLQKGPFGWPGDRCAGVPYPSDGGAEDAGPADSGPRGDTPPVPLSTDPGCVTASGGGPSWILGTLVALWWFRRKTA